jgi:biopolymer transport protein ExbD
MLRRPSHRRKSRSQEEMELPLVPIMDAFVTLIAFLLLVTSLLAVTLIDTPVPIVSSMREDSKEKPLMLTLTIKEDGLTLESAFRLIKPMSFPKIDVNYDLEKLHETLVGLKQQFPKDRSLVLMPVGEIKYNDIVQIMDAARLLAKTDPPFYLTGEDGVDRPDDFLFPNVIFGNVISGN